MKRCSDCVHVILYWPLLQDTPICSHPANEDKNGMWVDCDDKDAENCPYFEKKGAEE